MSVTYNGVTYEINIPEGTATVIDSRGGNFPPNLVIPDTVYYPLNSTTSYNVVGLGTTSFGSVGSRLTSITLPNSGYFTKIGFNSLFATNITSITIPNSVTTIDFAAFQQCVRLTTVNIDPLNSSLEIIKNSAFFNCTSLNSIKIPTKVTSIEGSAFENCTSLSKVYFYPTIIPIIGNTDAEQFEKIAPGATAYVLYGVDISRLVSGGGFTYYTVFDPIPCFKEDTLILTDKGYRRIQELRKGDLVKTLLNGFLKIDMIGKRNIDHKACFEDRITDQLYKCSHENFKEVFEPLILTGCHSILVDEFVSEEQKQKAITLNKNRLCVTDHKYRLPACLDERTTVYEIPGTYTIYHLALENPDYYMNYGIYANGLLVETCSRRYLKELSGMELIE